VLKSCHLASTAQHSMDTPAQPHFAGAGWVESIGMFEGDRIAHTPPGRGAHYGGKANSSLLRTRTDCCNSPRLLRREKDGRQISIRFCMVALPPDSRLPRVSLPVGNVATILVWIRRATTRRSCCGLRPQTSWDPERNFLPMLSLTLNPKREKHLAHTL